MKLLFYLFMLLLKFYYSYIITPIINFEKKLVTLTQSNNFIIYSYYIPGSPYLTNYYHQMKCYGFDYHTMLLDFYLYEDKSQINQDSDGNFINYIKKRYSDYILYEDSFRYNKTYYFVIKDNVKDTKNFTLSIYSTETLTNIDNFIYAKLDVYPGDIYNYKFHIPLEHKKYLLYEIRTVMLINITLVDNNKKIIYQENATSGGANYLELKDEYSYNIYLSFSENKKYSSEGFIYFYLTQSKYKMFVPVLMNTEYFQHFYAYKKFKLLLDFSSIKKGYIVWVEYTKGWGFNLYQFSLNLYGYDTEDEDIIEKTEGKKLELNREEYCYDNICNRSIHKDSNDIKTVIIEVNNDYRLNSFYFDIRYGKKERYRAETFLYSFIIGISLSVPNILAKLMKCSNEPDRKCHYNCTLILDLILHLAHGCLFSIIFYLGGKTSRTVCYLSYGGYAVLFIVNIILAYNNIDSIFMGFICIMRKMKNYRTFKEVLNENKKLPPRVIISDSINYNQEGENYEYEYCSWEDNTKFCLLNKNPVIECKFSFEINNDKETREDIEDFKNSLDNNNNNYETPTDDGEHNTKKYYEHYLVPDFSFEETCFSEPTNSKDKFIVFLWFIALITGYLDILEIFIYYSDEDNDTVEVRIIKLISNSKKLRANYNSNDYKFEKHNLPNENEIYETKKSSENIDTKEVELIG